MAKRLLLIAGMFLFAYSVFGQLPPPCPSNSTPPSDFCNQTCIYCNFNGIQSSTAGYTGQTPSGFCGTIENEQWLGFIAGETSATFTAIPSGCTNGDGIQVAVYSGCSGSPLGCYGGTGGGGTTPATVSVSNMVPGQNYFFMIDGFAGDQCNFTIVASPPSAITPPIPSAPTQINGPTSVCPNSVVEYCVPAIPGAAAYTWQAPADALINGMPPPATILGNMTGNCVTITFGSGSGVICVNGANSCFTGPPACQPVINAPIAPTFLPDTTICQADLPYIAPWGESIVSTGSFPHTYITDIGCDSVVRQFVFVKIPIPSVIPPVTLCDNETFSVCGVNYSQAPGTNANYQALCMGSDGCDSIVNFTLIAPDLDATIQGGGMITCNSGPVVLSYPPGAGTPTWFNSPNTIPISNNPTYTATTGGTYVLELEFIVGTGSCSAFDTIVIAGNTTPPSAVPSTGAQVGCGTTTMISVATNATNPTFSWGPGTTPNNTPSVSVSSPGDFDVTVTDGANGCTSVATVTVAGSTDIPQLAVAGNSLDCSVTSSTITSTTTAAGLNYLWSTTDTAPTITTTTPGTYTLTVTDPANSCTNEASYVVTSNTTPPPIVTSSTGVIDCNVTTLDISTISDSTNLTYAWSAPGSGSMISVTSAGAYTVTVTASNGCTNTATQTITEDLAEPGVSSNVGTLTCTATSIPLLATSPSTSATYNWGGGNTNATNQVSTPGTYTVTATGANGCTSTFPAVVDQDITPPNASATGGIITCASSSLQLMGSSTTTPVSYEWTSPGGGVQTGATPTVMETGDFILTVTNTSNGCTSTATATVVPDSNIPNASATGGTLDCTNTLITINGSSTTPGVTMTWNGPTGMLSGAAPMVNAPGDYTLTVLDPANGCDATSITTVAQDLTQPAFSLSPGALSCTVTDTDIQLILDPPSQTGLTYSWTSSSSTGFSSSLQNPSISQPGSYTVVVTGPNGCTSTNSATIAADVNLPVAQVSGGTLDCNVTAIPVNLNIQATGAVTSTTWTGPNGFTSTDEDITANEQGDYIVTVTTDNGCSSTATATIDGDFTEPDLVADGGVIGCAAPNTDLASSSTVAMQFAWTGPGGYTSNNPNPNVNIDGDYTVTATGPNGCTSIETVTVSTDYDSANVSIAQPITLDCNNTIIDIDATVTSNTVAVQDILWSASNGYSNTIEDPDDIDQPGTYVVLVTTVNGCTSTETIVVDQDITQPDATANGETLTCIVTSNTLTGGSITPGATFQWTTPSMGTINEQSPTVTVPGDYILLVTGPNGCTNTAMATMSLDGDFPDGLVDAPIPTITCDNPQVVLTASSTVPTATFAWFDSAGGAVGTGDAMITVDADDTYTVNITDSSNGCVTPVEQIIAIDQVAPDASATGDTTDCITGVGTLAGMSAVPNAEYTWDFNGNIFTGQMISVGAPGTYTLTVENPVNGCTESTTAILGANTDSPVIAVQASANILNCNVANINLDGTITSPAAPTISWISNGASVGSMEDLDVTNPGTYTLEVTDPANNCVSTFDVVITDDYAEPGVAADDVLINCAVPTETLLATSDTAVAVFEWTDANGAPVAGANLTVTTPGTYTVLATGSNGCTSTSTATVTGDFVDPDIDVQTQTITCTVPTVTLDATSAVAGLTYDWTNSLPSVEDPTTSAGGDYTVMVTNPANGCTNDFTITVPVDQVEPMATAAGDTLTCDVVSIPVMGGSPTAGVSYQWFLGDLTGTPISTDQNPDVTEATNYIVVVTDPTNGCTSTATATVIPDENAPQVAAAGGNIDCQTPSTTLSGSSTTPNVTFAWSGPNSFTSTDENPMVDAEGDYTLVVSADNGCTTVQTVQVAGDFIAPTLTVSPPDKIDCNNSSITISSNGMGQGSITYDWTVIAGQILGGSTSQSPEVGAGTYTVVITDSENGCTSEEDVTVEADPATPSGAIQTIRDISCFGETDGAIIIQDIVGGTPPFMYSFENGPFAAQTQWTFLEPGSYDVTVQDILGCEWSTVYEIIEPEELMIDLGPDLVNLDAGPDQILFLGDSVDIAGDMVINFPDRVEQYIVSPEEMYQYICDTCQGTFWQAFYTQRYEVTIIDSNGCKAADERLLVVDRTRNVYVPNVFNPLSTDGTNHLLTVYGNLKHVKGIKSFKLYDRWGEAIYERFEFPANNTDGAWDGTYQGKRLNPGVFVWVAEVEFIDGVIELYKGDVAIIGN